MTAIPALLTQKKFKKSEIPPDLIYEVLDGKPIYYKGYKAVLNHEKTLDDIMAIGYLQTIILNLLNEYFILNFRDKGLQSFMGEVGVHIKKGNNLSCDLIVFEQAALKNIPITREYFKIPPKIVIEADTNGDFEDKDFYTYVFDKTRTLLNFGVEKVIWILTKHKVAIIATPNKAWAIHPWDLSLEIIEGHEINLAALFKTRGVE